MKPRTKAPVSRETLRHTKAHRKPQERPGRGDARTPGRRPGRGRGAAPAVREVALSEASVLAYVRAGCPGPLESWATMPPELQATLERAGTAVRAEFALAVAAAIRSEEGAESVAAVVDGGAGADEVWVHRALDRAKSMLKRVPQGAGAVAG